MKIKKLNKEQSRSVITGLIISLLLCSILVISAIYKFDLSDSLIALSVSQLGIASIWLIIRFGLFSTSSYGSRRYAKSQLHKRNEKIGIYQNKKDSKIEISEYNNARDLEEKSNNKSKAGIYTMLSIGTIELLIAIIFTFT